MNHNRFLHPLRIALGAAIPLAVTALALGPIALHAQGDKKKNPASKMFIADVNGNAQIDTGDNIQDLNKKSVYNAEGTTIETKKAGANGDKGQTYTTSVFSNGTGAYFDEDTKVEVKKFVQEPFTPNRTDMDVEPSISQTQAVVSRGTVGLCSSKPVAGSSTNFSTSQGSVNIRGGKIVIEANDNETKVSMLDGDSTVRGGDLDMGGNVLKSGQQAIIRKARAGQPSQVVVQPIPPTEMRALDDKVSMACMAKKTVYFEVKERGVTNAAELAAAEAGGASIAASGDNTASGGDSGTSPTSGGTVTAFDGQAANSSAPKTITIVREIVPVEIVPVNLPVQYTVSPARIVTPKPGG